MSAQRPTEAGRYIDAFGNTWRLWNDGLFRMLGNSDADPERYGPWKKLVVAEEPEWEWMVTTEIPDAPTFASGPTDEETARAILRWSEEDGLERALHRRLKAGPWVPVKQEGADDVRA